MSYLVYFLFIIWILSGLGGLLAGALIKFGPADAPRVSNQPAWFQFLTGAYKIAMTVVIWWLYSTGVITSWWVLVVGVLVALPEIISWAVKFVRG